MAFLLTILVIYATVSQGVASPPSCFSCSSITQARYCDFYTQCDEGEVCFVEKTENQNGHFKYTSGCMHNTTCETFFNNATSNLRSSMHEHSVCRDCCHGDMCNNKGCGDHGPSNTRGPYCFQCDHLSDPSECDHVTICDINEVCGVVEEFFQHERQFSTGSMRRSECQESLIFGREVNRTVKSANLCRRCCEHDLCNHQCTYNPLVFKSCDDHYRAGSVKSGIYTISPDDVNTFDVYCDMEDGDGGWIVLQHRFNGSVLFNRSFSDYENGFGQLDGEFWLGLKKMYILAHSSRKIRFNLQAVNGTWFQLEYGDFSIANASQQYTLHVTNHIKGFEAQTFEWNSGQVFSTYDSDTPDQCGTMRYAGFWYDSCTLLNINGPFDWPGQYTVSVHNVQGNGNYITFQKTMMMLQ